MGNIIRITEADLVRIVRKLVKEDGPVPPAAPAAPAAPTPPVDYVKNLNTLYNDRVVAYAHNDALSNPVDYDYIDPQFFIMLKSGKFEGAKVPKQLIVDVITASKRAGLDPYILLGLIGQESTFGNGSGESRRSSKQSLCSGWNLLAGYAPYEFARFLSDNRVPGVSYTKDIHGYHFYINDANQVNQYIAKHPDIAKRYTDKLNSTPPIPANFDNFYQAAVFIKTRGLKAYNPGDPKYVGMVMQCVDLLRRDPAMTAFMRHPVVPPHPQYTPGRQARRKKR